MQWSITRTNTYNTFKHTVRSYVLIAILAAPFSYIDIFNYHSVRIVTHFPRHFGIFEKFSSCIFEFHYFVAFTIYLFLSEAHFRVANSRPAHRRPFEICKSTAHFRCSARVSCFQVPCPRDLLPPVRRTIYTHTSLNSTRLNTNVHSEHLVHVHEADVRVM